MSGERFVDRAAEERRRYRAKSTSTYGKRTNGPDNMEWFAISSGMNFEKKVRILITPDCHSDWDSLKVFEVL